MWSICGYRNSLYLPVFLSSANTLALCQPAHHAIVGLIPGFDAKAQNRFAQEFVSESSGLVYCKVCKSNPYGHWKLILFTGESSYGLQGFFGSKS
jgi:hypothetical protein